MYLIRVKKGWHKVTDAFAMTYEQLQYINDLRDDDNVQGWDFVSSTNARRRLTKSDAAQIIGALLDGGRVIIEKAGDPA